jgi:hypothetical protein
LFVFVILALLFLPWTLSIKSLWVWFFGFFIGNGMSLDWTIAMIISFVSSSHFVCFSLDHCNHESMIHVFSWSFHKYCCRVFSLWEPRVIQFPILSDIVRFFASSLVRTQLSVFHRRGPNPHNSMNKKGSYHRYLAEQRR